MEALKGIEETATILGISPWTVRYLLKTGKLARVKVGRRVLIEPKELERFIEQCRQESRPQQEQAGEREGAQWQR